jgi:hypothetical protein
MLEKRYIAGVVGGGVVGNVFASDYFGIIGFDLCRRL